MPPSFLLDICPVADDIKRSLGSSIQEFESQFENRSCAMRTTLRLLATRMLFILTLLLGSQADAQETIFSNIRGIVTDPSGSVLAGVKVDLLNQGTTVSRS